MKNLILSLLLFASALCGAQTFPVNNLQVNGVATGPATTVSNIASLQSLSCTPGQVYQTRGYRTPSDGVVSTYSCVGSDTTSTANGGTIIAAANSYRYHLQYSTAPTWKQFGAYGDGVHDDATYINNAVSASVTTIADSGNFAIGSPIYVTSTKGSILGSGKGVTYITALSTFTGSTLGGYSASPLIWVQAPGTWNSTSGWIQGGTISGMSLNAGNYAQTGIMLNRMVESTTLRDLDIVNAPVGIWGTFYGWNTTIENTYIHSSTLASIRLGAGYNGVTLKGNYLYGETQTTQYQLQVIGPNSYGISIVGGAIEGALVGVGLNDSSATITGVDFEAISYNFIQHQGLYTGTYPTWTLQQAAPVLTVVGNNFVGVPRNGITPFVGGIAVYGGTAVVQGNYFINNDAAPPAGVYAINGVTSGDVISGFPPPSIAENANAFVGWNNQNFTGIVYTRFGGGVATDSLQFGLTKKTLTGTGAVASSYLMTDYQTGTWVPVLNSWTGTGTFTNSTWTKVGNLVTVTFNAIAGTTFTTTTSSTVTGFPFTPSQFGTCSVVSGTPTSLGSSLIGTAGGGTLYMPASSGNSQIIATCNYTTN